MRLAQQAAISHITPCGLPGCGLGHSEALHFPGGLKSEVQHRWLLFNEW
jgi:hypothetical protein